MANNNCLKFDGVNDYVITNQFAISGTDRTFELWMKTPGTTNYEGILQQNSSVDNTSSKYISGFQGRTGISNAIYLIVGNGVGAESLETSIESYLNQWIHLVGIIKGSDELRIYINGVSVVDRSISISPETVARYVMMGRVATQYLNGTIDEVKIYNRALTAAEVKASYLGQTVSETGLIAEYFMNEGTGTEIADTSGSGNTGTLTGGTAWEERPLYITTGGDDNNCLNFDETDDYVSCGNDSSLNITTEITLEAWVKMNAYTDYDTIVWKTYNSTGGSAGCYGLSSTIDQHVRFAMFDMCISPNIFPIGQWIHLVGTYDHENMRLYENGVLVQTEPKTDNIRTSVQDLIIGNRKYDAGLNYDFDGLIDEVRIYNRALSANEVKSSYLGQTVSRTGLMAEYLMQEGTGTEIADTSDESNTGTLVNTPAWTIRNPYIATSGDDNNCLSFDGVDDYVNCGNATSLDVDTLTASSWIKTTGTGYKMWIARGGGQYWLSHDTSRLHFCITTSTGRKDLYTTINYYDNKWHHVVNTYDGAYMKMYMDGVEINSFAKTGTISGLTDLLIGRYSSSYQFTGSVDDVRIYNRALTATEIKASYLGQEVSRTGLVGEWLMQEGTGTEIADTSGEGNTGTLTNGPTWTIRPPYIIN